MSRHTPSGPKAWLFTGPTGDPPHQNSVGYWWRKTLRDGSLSGIKLHDLRHFLASGLIAEGCAVVIVQRALGHSKPTTTLNTYAHLWPTAEARTRKAAQSLMDAVVPDFLADSVRTDGTSTRLMRKRSDQTLKRNSTMVEANRSPPLPTPSRTIYRPPISRRSLASWLR